MAMIGQSPSLPLSALTLHNKTVRAVNVFHALFTDIPRD